MPSVGAVTNSKLASDAVTSDKIQGGEVNTDDIATGAITGTNGSNGWFEISDPNVDNKCAIGKKT